MTKSIKDYIFLLGGHDLEMIEIIKILERQNIGYLDHNLAWGAKLSAYQDQFDEINTFVGVELVQDCDPPKDYILIDHHNENSHKASSIEQVAELLGIKELSRHQQLVAANDRGYIPAMQEMGATDKEIKDIRSADRKEQGVTEKDEKLAAESIEKHQWKIGNVIIIESLTPKFSAITDQLFPYDELLIRHKNSLTYYGKKAPDFAEQFKGLIEQHKAYSGGQKQTFFGVDANNCSEDEARESYIHIVNQIKHMETHSYHIFMFPFRLEVKDPYIINKENSELFKQFEPLLNLNDWQNDSFDNDNLMYNHEKYFYDFDILQKGFTDSKAQQDLVLHKRFSNLENATYIIEIYEKVKKILPEPLLKDTFWEMQPPEFKKSKFELEIDKISLDIYPNEVGVLSFHLKNGKYKNAQDILLINQYGRRIYAPFKDTRYKDFEQKWGITDELKGTKYRELAKKISIRFKDAKGESKEYHENFSKNNSDRKFCVPVHFAFLIKENDDIKIKPLLDDRMFVMSWYGSFQLDNEFKRRKILPKIEREKYKYCISEITQRVNGGYEVTSAYRNFNQHRALSLNTSYDGYGYATNDFWYQYVFVDSTSPSCANELIRRRQLESHTYDRWIENNTLYGISRFSFVCITESFPSLCSPVINAAFIPEHFKTIYFRMASLALAQRVSILGFSKMISCISFEELKENQNKKRDKFLNIYEDYRRFINEIYHREVTAQEQGIELYDMLQDHLRIKEHAKELEKEFIEMNRLVDLIGVNDTNKRMRVLTVIGTAFAIFSILFGLQNSDYFKNIMESNFTDLFGQPFCFDCAFPILMISALVYFLLNGLLLWYKKKRRNRFYFLGLSAFFFILYLVTYKMQPADIKFVGSILILAVSIIATWKITFFHSNKS